MRIVAVFFIVFLQSCQLFRAPAAKVLSWNLPDAEAVVKSEDNQVAADYNVTVLDTAGNKHLMSEFKGKMVFFNLWATWCAPCLAELPAIERLVEQVKEDNIVFVLASNEDLKVVRRFAARKKYKLPFYVLDPAANLPLMYHTYSVPTTYLISPDGYLLERSVGAQAWDSDQFINFVKERSQNSTN